MPAKDDADKSDKDKEEQPKEEGSSEQPKEHCSEKPPAQPEKKDLGEAEDPKQPTIVSLFKKMSEKRKAEDEIENEKRAKIEPSVSEEKVAEGGEDKGNVETVETKPMLPKISVPEKCSECKQFLSRDLKFYPGGSADAVEEFVMLTDPRLSIHGDGDYENEDVTERPQHKITDFCVYDKYTHLCPFDSGLIETNVELYLSGVVKPIYADDPSPAGGILATNLGPIIEWWVSGYDGGELALIGFGTAFAEYVLMEPSELYAPFMDAVQEKIYMIKAVIELLTRDNEATYEDLMNSLQTTTPPKGVAPLSEDSLLRHAQFVVDQVQSFDYAAEDYDNIFITSPCMRALIELSGVRLGITRSVKGILKKRASKPKKRVQSKATTTPLVRRIFENLFIDQLEESKQSTARKRRCGVCEICQLPDCGKCSFCKDMLKFGGSGRSKQACVKRRCPNMAVQEATEDDILTDRDGDEMDIRARACEKEDRKVKKYVYNSEKIEIEWIGVPFEKDNRSYYGEVCISEEDVKVIVQCGDFVLVRPSESGLPMYIARVMSMWKDKSGRKSCHAMWFHRGSDTVLGETSNPQEIFGSFDCDDVDIRTIYDTIHVSYVAPPKNWQSLGGFAESIDKSPMFSNWTVDGHQFYYQKWYDSDYARFENPPRKHLEPRPGYSETSQDYIPKPKPHSEYCVACLKKKADDQLGYVELKDSEEKEDRTVYDCASWKGLQLHTGDCIFIKPEAYPLNTKEKESKKVLPEKHDVNEDMYPEAYRKTDYVKGCNLDVPEPFRIGYISEIFQKHSKKQAKPKLLVKKFYRPENTHKNFDDIYKEDLNLLYWSDEEVEIEFTDIEGKCHVAYSLNLTESVELFTRKGPHCFYFNESYNSTQCRFDEPPTIARRLGRVSKGTGKRSKKMKERDTTKPEKEFWHAPMEDSDKLNTLDIFAGCGGLSEGFHQSGISDTIWAIEKDVPAALAFHKNFRDCNVLIEDCNFLLKEVMERNLVETKGQAVPQKGEVEMICGGPPCQGFSGMNRFNCREYSLFKNSLIVSYLSYCDYYRPKYFILENVRNFVSFKKSMVLKLTLSCLISMGYQCTFGVLQAGNYGVPQTRRRAIILAAAPGLTLPFFPEPLHVFSPRACQLSVVVDDKKFDSNIKWTTSAPFRTITVRDALNDLPEIKNGAKSEEIPYDSEPLSHYQRNLRNPEKPTVKDHVCKDLSALVEARMKLIPPYAGADWRDLPNIITKLSDGTSTTKLVYAYDDIKNGPAENGAKRGVCRCATTGNSKSCDPADRQFNTIIPWCLPHTGNRHNHWAGLYGRLDWDGFFSTTITNPEPMGKQGRVLHPQQSRVVSVRECARSQGFPDSYKFYGAIQDRHRQIGNAVPPPLAAAIGHEIRKAVAIDNERARKPEDIPPDDDFNFKPKNGIGSRRYKPNILKVSAETS